MCENALGHAAAYPFHFKVLDNSPIRQHPIVYPSEKRKLIDEHLRGQAEIGTMREVTRADKNPIFICSIV